MKAIVQHTYGSADVLQFKEIDKPLAGDNDVLIQVHAASLHIGDRLVMNGKPYLLRIVGFGLLKPNVVVRGMDVAGKVEAVGRNVTQFQPGDDVFGTCEGAFADYACAPQHNFAHKPVNLTFEQASAVPTSGFAALQALRDRGEIQPGQKALIIGAYGGVGIYAVQIAKSFGAEVTGVCSTMKMDLVHALGADHVFDYTKGDFTRHEQQYDLILDMGGHRQLSDLRRVLSDSGTLVLVGAEGGNRFWGGMDRWIQAAMLSPFVRHKLRSLASKPNQKDLQLLKELIETGKLMPVIDRTYPLSQVPDAFRYLEAGNARGKLVITIKKFTERT